MSVATEAPLASTSSSGSKLEPLLLLAKSTKPRGAAAANLVQQATSAPGIYFFGELFDVPGIAELAGSQEPALRQSYQVLQLFAYGTWADFRTLAGSVVLSAEQEYKLRQLTILSLASQTKVLRYHDLFHALAIDAAHLRQLEDLVIETVYAGLLSGKLNQLHSRFEVHHVQGRDVPPPATSPAQVDHMHATLSDWQLTAQTVLSALDSRMTQIKSSAATATAQRQDDNSLLLQNLIAAQQLAEKQQHQSKLGIKGKGPAAMDVDDGEHRPSSLRKKGAGPGGVRGSKRSRA